MAARPAVYVHPVPEDAPDAARAFEAACRERVARLGLALAASPAEALVAVAPLLTRKLAPSEWSAPAEGTLVFHPSALPRHRGPDAIRHTFAAREAVSAATWFWCDDGLDTGPVCEQEVVLLDLAERARDAYATRFVPAALRALERALSGVVRGAPRRVPQDPRLATYESYLVDPAARRARVQAA